VIILLINNAMKLRTNHWFITIRQGYADRTAFLQRKKAGQLYFSNISSV